LHFHKTDPFKVGPTACGHSVTTITAKHARSQEYPSFVDCSDSAPSDCCLLTVDSSSRRTSSCRDAELCPRLFTCPPRPPASYSTLSRYFEASAVRAQSCSSNCCARARTRGSLSSKARINGSTAPGGADCAQVSRAWSRTRTFGELSFWAIHSGTTRPSIGCPGSEDRPGTAWGLSPPGTVPVPDTEPAPFTEARGIGLAAWVTGVNGLLPGDEPCLDRDGPSRLTRDSRLGTLSDEAGPQPASPARSIRLRSSARRGRRGIREQSTRG